MVFCAALSAFMLMLRYSKANISTLEKDNMQKSSIEMGFGEKDAMTGYGTAGLDAYGQSIYADKSIDKADVYADILSITDRYDEEDLENGDPIAVTIDQGASGKIVLTSLKVQSSTPNAEHDFTLLDIKSREKQALYKLLNIDLTDGKYQRRYIYDKQHSLIGVVYQLQ